MLIAYAEAGEEQRGPVKRSRGMDWRIWGQITKTRSSESWRHTIIFSFGVKFLRKGAKSMSIS